MAMKYLSCTVRPTNPAFADLIVELWSEFENGATRAARLVRQLDKLECIDQALIYEERYKVDLGEFMQLAEQITIPELRSWVDIRLRDYEDLKSRKSTDMIIAFVSGGPGVGKGTQCARVAGEFDFHHISVGNLLRQEANTPTSPFKEFILESMEKSVPIPAQFTTHLLKEEMGKALDNEKWKFLLDGFPRTVAQVADFELKISNRHYTISLDCSDDEMRRRLEKRAESSNRIDDNPDAVVRRLHTFRENNAPVLEYLHNRGKVYPVDCSGSIDDVYYLVRNSIGEILKEPK